MRRTYRPAEVCRLAHIIAPQLEYVVQLGALKPLQPAPKPGSYRLYSLTNVYEAALAGELIAVGITGQRLCEVFAALHASLATVPARLHATATFLRYVEAVKAIATILGQDDDPVHRAWLREVEEVVRRWECARQPVEPRLLPLLAGREIGNRSSSSEAPA
ncbi:MAG TPA: hypothetical protein VFO67_08125 [Gemmatimonadales bacterium]|nr:hypothetical protein [Gemmatimonadales bacterium]